MTKKEIQESIREFEKISVVPKRLNGEVVKPLIEKGEPIWIM